MRPQLKVSSDGLVKPGIEPVTPGLQGERFSQYTTAAPIHIFRAHATKGILYMALIIVASHLGLNILSKYQFMGSHGYESCLGNHNAFRTPKIK